MQNNSTLPDTGFVRIKDVLRAFPVSRSGFWAGIRAGKYPKPVKLGIRCSAWRVEDIKKLIEQTASDTKKVGAP